MLVPKMRLRPSRDIDIVSDSHGEITDMGMYNFRYKNPRPIPNGLFCQAIFGPIRDYVCHCDVKYTMKHKGMTCKDCGVLITTRDIRNSRYGYINTHTKYVNPISIKILAGLLHISNRTVSSILNGTTFFRMEEVESNTCQLYSKDGRNYNIMLTNTVPSDDDNTWHTSAVELYNELNKLNLDNEKVFSKSSNINLYNYYDKDGYTVLDFFNSCIRVTPPSGRDVQVSNNDVTFHHSNYFYRRYIRIASRVAKTISILEGSDNLNDDEIKQLQSIIRNESIVLQNIIESQLVSGTKDYREIEIPSVIDSLGGKEGLARGNLLGKRVDFSARSVIVSGPYLPLDTIEVPWYMMYELLKPFIMNKLIEDHENENGLLTIKKIRQLKKRYEDRHPDVVEILYDIIGDHRIMMNRAPSLHRYSVMSFRISLTHLKCISMPPMVCSPFNADFDGDTMSVHLLLSDQARSEYDILSVPSNLNSSINWDQPNLSPSHEQIVGLYLTTM